MSIVALGDLHCPFQHDKAVNWAISIIRDLKPKHVVQIGDAYDQLAYTKYSKPESSEPASTELARAQSALGSIWERVGRAAPKARRVGLLGNHDMRAIRRIHEKMPEAEALIDLKRFYSFPGVEMLLDDREHLDIGPVRFIHGYLSQLGAHARFNERSVVCGHSHTGGVVYQRAGGRIRWELNCGYLGDERSAAFRYLPQRISKWTVGIGVIDGQGPRFIPYPGKA